MTTVPPPRSGKQQLLEAAQAAVQDQVTKARLQAIPAARPRPWVLGTSLMVLAVVGVYVGVARPDWIFPGRLLPEPPALREASWRMAILREAKLVEAFRAKQGKLPADLMEVGTPNFGISYRRNVDGTFSLTADSITPPLAYQSTDSAKTFLGESLNRLVERGKAR